MSLIGDERVINFQRTKACVFSDSVLCLGGEDFREHPIERGSNHFRFTEL